MTEFQSKAFPVIALSVAAIVLSACVAGGGSWYDRHCQRKGYQPGTAAFDRCKAETREWIEWTQREADSMRSGGLR